MKKFKKTAVIRRLRRLLHTVILLRDKHCQRCGRKEGKLDCSHIFPKGHYPAMQFMPENCKLLCYQCHRWWHENPLEATNWIKKYLTAERFCKLFDAKEKSILITRPFLEETERILFKQLSDLKSTSRFKTFRFKIK